MSEPHNKQQLLKTCKCIPLHGLASLLWYSCIFSDHTPAWLHQCGPVLCPCQPYPSWGQHGTEAAPVRSVCQQKDHLAAQHQIVVWDFTLSTEKSLEICHFDTCFSNSTQFSTTQVESVRNQNIKTEQPPLLYFIFFKGIPHPLLV